MNVGGHPMQQLLHDAAAAGTAVARSFVDAFEEGNRSPSPADLVVLEENANRHFAQQPIVWTDPVLVDAWRVAMQAHLAERLKIFRRPQQSASIAPSFSPSRSASPGARWSGPFGITK
jgi:hypothetical protein